MTAEPDVERHRVEEVHGSGRADERREQHGEIADAGPAIKHHVVFSGAEADTVPDRHVLPERVAEPELHGRGHHPDACHRPRHRQLELFQRQADVIGGEIRVAKGLAAMDREPIGRLEPWNPTSGRPDGSQHEVGVE